MVISSLLQRLIQLRSGTRNVALAPEPEPEVSGSVG
jgi:hypothetical protein